MGRLLILVVVVLGCSKAADEYRLKSKATEAALWLNMLGKRAKLVFEETRVLPKGKAGPTPAQNCCRQPQGTCPVTSDWRTDPVWSALDLVLDEPSRYQYSYVSDGTTATATAVGDLDCDGVPATFRLDLKPVGTTVEATLTEPPPGIY